MTEEEERSLRRCRLFRGVPEPELKRLGEIIPVRRRELKRGDALWLTGDRVTACAVVLSGSFRAETGGAEGGRVVMARHGPGALLGDVLMVNPDFGSPVDVFAAADGAVLLLPFEEIMAGTDALCRSLQKNLLSEVAEKFWALREKIGYLSLHRLRARVARKLLDEAERTGSDTFSLGMSREELADLLCVNRSALSRELSRMRTEGLIDFYKDSFRITDKEALRREPG